MCIDNLGMRLIVLLIEEDFGANYKTENFPNCTSDICKDSQENAVRILLMLWMTMGGIPLGSFIAQFIHLNNFKSFGSCRHDLCDTYTLSFNCTGFDENEKKLHAYFTEISKSFGFNDSELLSLYELPGMLADKVDYYPTASVNGKIEADFLLGDLPQAYLYSDCKEREHINFTINYRTSSYYLGQFQQCYWSEEKLNETGTV